MYQGDYRLVGNELSLFTRKLEAQLRFQRLPWRCKGVSGSTEYSG